MVLRIDRKKPSTKVSAGKSKGGAKGAGAARGTGRGAGEGKVDRFEALGRLVGGSGPSSIISAGGPGRRVMVPLTTWEKYDIDHDPMFREAASRMKAYKNLPDPWKRKVDEWGKKVNKEMRGALAKAIMKT